MTKILEFVLRRVENISGKGENAGYQNVFKSILPQGSLTLSQTTILDSTKLKEFADNNLKFDENGTKSSTRIENATGKGEIAECFQKTCTADT